MTNLPARFSLVLAAVLAALMASPSPVSAGRFIPTLDPPSRSSRPEVDVIARGEGTQVVLRWRPAADQPQVVQVGTRTVPSVLESPGLDGTDADLPPVGFRRPPIEKLFTLQGRVSRVDAASDRDGSPSDPLEIRWRVMDAAARLFGVRTVVGADVTPEPAGEGDDTGTGQDPPPTGDRPSPVEPVSSHAEDSDRDRGSDPTEIQKALQFERITNQSLQKVDGAAITQTFGAAGVLPASTTVRLVVADRRADHEASGLATIIALGQPTLPDEPLGVGGSWRTRDTTMVQSFPVTTEATWTVASFDEEATTIGMASRAVLRIEFSRRIAADLQVPEAIRATIEADGRGEVTITLDAPTRLQGRFVQSPIAKPRPGHATEVTRMRLDPLASR